MKVGGTCPAFPFLPVLLFTVSPPGVLPRNPTSEAVGCRVLLRATWERTAPRSLRARHPSRRDKLTASSPRLCCRGHLQLSPCLCSLTSSPPQVAPRVSTGPAASSAATASTALPATPPPAAAAAPRVCAASAARQVPPAHRAPQNRQQPRVQAGSTSLPHPLSPNRLRGRDARGGMPAALRLRRERDLRPGHGALPLSPGENWPQVRLR